MMGRGRTKSRIEEDEGWASVRWMVDRWKETVVVGAVWEPRVKATKVRGGCGMS